MLPDVLALELKIVFCGTAAGAASARASAYYAGPGNKFWRTLHEVGFTPERLEPHQFQDVLGYGLGLTDVCKTASGSDREIGTQRWDVPGLIAKPESSRPKWVAFNGKKAAEAVLERKGRLRLASRTSWSGWRLRLAIYVGRCVWGMESDSVGGARKALRLQPLIASNRSRSAWWLLRKGVGHDALLPALR